MNSSPGAIGAVSYLNTKPLIFGIEKQVRMDFPSSLAADLRQGKLAAALIPIAEYLEHPHYQIIPDIAIGCRGAVRSVFLATQTDIPKIKVVGLDPPSKTSNLLIQVILKEFYSTTPEYEVALDDKTYDGRVFIGDTALTERAQLTWQNYNLLDLGQIWFEKTGLPFVFAFWALQKNLPSAPYVEYLSQAKKQGIKNIDAILKKETWIPSDIGREYLTKNIRYDFGPEEMKGLMEFQRLCLKHGLIANTVAFQMAG